VGYQRLTATEGRELALHFRASLARTEPFGDPESEPIEEQGLRLSGSNDAAQTKLASAGLVDRQDDIGAAQFCGLVENEPG